MKAILSRIKVLGIAGCLLWGSLGGSLPAAEAYAGEPAGPEQSIPRDLRTAFVRQGQLWLKEGGVERQLTAAGEPAVSEPVWSPDGAFIAYGRGALPDEEQVWVYSVAAGRSWPVGAGVLHRWAPGKAVLAFVRGQRLYRTEMTSQGPGAEVRAADSVGNYAWLPDGGGFLISTPAKPENSGWRDIRLYTVNEMGGGERTLRVIPAESPGFFAISTSTFRWSADRRWIAFVARPTASLSADANEMLVLSADGRKLRRAGVTLGYPDWWHWAPTGAKLGFIAGEGREAGRNKRLSFASGSAFQARPVPPQGYADGGFTWTGGRALVVSRRVEETGQGGTAAGTQPSLYAVQQRFPWMAARQVRLTQPPQGSGDYGPRYLQQLGRLLWVRSDGTRGDLWIGESDATRAALYIAGVDSFSMYYGHMAWNYDAVERPSRTAGTEPAAPPQLQWGAKVMEEAKKRYPDASIDDYLFVGRTPRGGSQVEDQFRLSLTKGGRQLIVRVTVLGDVSSGIVHSIVFTEQPT